MKKTHSEALKKFTSSGGILKATEAYKLGIYPRILKELADEGLITKLQRGLYALTNLPNIEALDYAPIVKRIPNSVICLTTALAFHELTVQIPKWIDIALPQKQSRTHIAHPPTQFHWFSDKVFNSGIELHEIGGLKVRIYSPEKTVVDCFRLRRKVGQEVAIEGLKRYLQTRNWDFPTLMLFAKESRVEKIMKPYIEAIIDEQS